MANISYLSLSGETQGLISAGCSTLDSVGNKAQPEHKDQIMVYALMHSISRSQNQYLIFGLLTDLFYNKAGKYPLYWFGRV